MKILEITMTKEQFAHFEKKWMCKPHLISAITLSLTVPTDLLDIGYEKSLKDWLP